MLYFRSIIINKWTSLLGHSVPKSIWQGFYEIPHGTNITRVSNIMWFFLCSSSVIVVIDAFLPERGFCLFFLTASIEAVSVEICVNIFIFLRSGACIRHCLSWQGPPLCSVLHMALILGGNSERVAHLWKKKTAVDFKKKVDQITDTCAPISELLSNIVFYPVLLSIGR